LTDKEELVLSESLSEQGEKLTPQNDAQGFNREQKVFTGRPPAHLIEGQSSCGDQTMEMKMIQQGLVPGMEHRDETDLSAKTGMAKLNERFANGFKEMA
jgi:hypothetical protein